MKKQDAEQSLNIDTHNLLIDTSKLFNCVHVIEQKFEIKPSKNHYGLAINHVDMLEMRKEFIKELISTVIDWVFSQPQQQEKWERYEQEGRTRSNISVQIYQEAKSFFRSAENSKLIKGQFGELFLANSLQNLFSAVPLLRKMPLTTSVGQERFGADAIHYKRENGEHLFVLGEAKCYSSKYKFNNAFSEGVSSIINSYEQHREELDLYLAGDFLDPQLRIIADAYKKGSLENAKVELVLIMIYEENRSKDAPSEEEIKRTIKEIIEDRFKNYDDSELNKYNPNVLSRITYIVFPVWELESLLQDFVGAL